MEENNKLSQAQQALSKIVTKEYNREYINSFKKIAKITDKLVNGDYEDEEEVVGVNALDVPCCVLHNETFIKGYELGFKESKLIWISCNDYLPDVNEEKRVLIHNSNKNGDMITIIDSSLLKHYNKEETHWMSIPKI